MQMVLTEKDKKLIVFLSIFVIVVALGWWGIRPALKAATEAKKDIAREEELKQENDMKIARIPILEERTRTNLEKIEEMKGDYFPMMNSDQIDKLFTGLVLERGFFAFDLNIHIDGTPMAMSPYRYSRMATDPYYDYGAEEAGDFEDNGDEEEAPEESEKPNVNEHVYRGHVSFRIGGNRDELQRLIDDLAAYEPMLLISGYSWSESSYVQTYEPAHTEEEEEDTGWGWVDETQQEEPEEVIPEDLPEGAHLEEDASGTYLVIVRQVLQLDLDIFMYKDDSAE